MSGKAQPSQTLSKTELVHTADLLVGDENCCLSAIETYFINASLK